MLAQKKRKTLQYASSNLENTSTQ